MTRKSKTDPWEKQEGETTKSYTAFCAYRDLRDDRSLSKTIPLVWGADYTGNPSAKQRRLEEWSAKFNWVSRCEAYDLYLEAKKRKENEKAISDMNKRHVQIAVLAMSKGVKKIESLIEQMDEDGNPLPLELTPREAIDLIDKAVKIERMGRGAPDQMVEHSGSIVQIIDDITHEAPDESKPKKPNRE